jgi:hypothetical protein
VRPEGRYLRLKYITTRLRPYSSFLADVVDNATKVMHIDEMPIRLNFGDLITAYAQKPGE